MKMMINSVISTANISVPTYKILDINISSFLSRKVEVIESVFVTFSQSRRR